MGRLMRANLHRLKKNRIFWSFVGILICWNFMQTVLEVRTQAGHDAALRFLLQAGALFWFLIPLHLLLALFCGLFVGEEYRDGTIRNKIILGSSRRTIYLANFYTNALVGALLFLAGAGSGILFRVLFSLEIPGEQILLPGIAGMVSCCAAASVYTLPAMLLSKRPVGTAASVLIAAGMLMAGFSLQERLAQPMEQKTYVTENGTVSWETEENPEYVGGDVRAVCEMTCDLLPGGQTAQILYGTLFGSGWNRGIRLAVLLACSLAVSCLCNSMGIFFFWRKDIFP